MMNGLVKAIEQGKGQVKGRTMLYPIGNAYGESGDLMIRVKVLGIVGKSDGFSVEVQPVNGCGTRRVAPQKLVDNTRAAITKFKRECAAASMARELRRGCTVSALRRNMRNAYEKLTAKQKATVDEVTNGEAISRMTEMSLRLVADVISRVANGLPPRCGCDD